MNQTPHDPAAAHARLADSAWAVVRQEYESGQPPSILAERHGLGERTIRRRAAVEGWTRRVVRPFGTAAGAEAEGRDDWVEHYARQRREAVDDLLLIPSPEGLLHLAFGRAIEAATAGRPTEATAWMRLVDQIRRNHAAIDQVDDMYHQSDLRRAAWAERAWGLPGSRCRCTYADEEEEEDFAPEPEAEGAAPARALAGGREP